MTVADYCFHVADIVSKVPVDCDRLFYCILILFVTTEDPLHLHAGGTFS